jgi:hypothetical protein
MCVVPHYAGIARDHDSALCGIALDHDPALCGIARVFFVKNLYVDQALCCTELDHDPALCGIAQDLDTALYDI